MTGVASSPFRPPTRSARGLYVDTLGRGPTTPATASSGSAEASGSTSRRRSVWSRAAKTAHRARTSWTARRRARRSKGTVAARPSTRRQHMASRGYDGKRLMLHHRYRPGCGDSGSRDRTDSRGSGTDRSAPGVLLRDAGVKRHPLAHRRCPSSRRQRHDPRHAEHTWFPFARQMRSRRVADVAEAWGSSRRPAHVPLPEA